MKKVYLRSVRFPYAKLESSWKVQTACHAPPAKKHAGVMMMMMMVKGEITTRVVTASLHIRCCVPGSVLCALHLVALFI